MESEKIDRLNALARKAKAGEALSEAEQAERDALRREYVDAVKGNLRTQLDNAWVVGPDGTKRRLVRREEGTK